jgi:hypothetical protein
VFPRSATSKRGCATRPRVFAARSSNSARLNLRLLAADLRRRTGEEKANPKPKIQNLNGGQQVAHHTCQYAKQFDSSTLEFTVYRGWEGETQWLNQWMQVKLLGSLVSFATLASQFGLRMLNLFVASQQSLGEEGKP